MEERWRTRERICYPTLDDCCRPWCRSCAEQRCLHLGSRSVFNTLLVRGTGSPHDVDKTSLRWGLFSPEPPSNKSAQVALLHWTRSAGQGDVDAMVKLGDYYYNGLVVKEPNVLLKEKA